MKHIFDELMRVQNLADLHVFRIIEDSARWYIAGQEVEGRNEEMGCIILQAAVGMFGYMTELSTVEETGTETIEAEGN